MSSWWIASRRAEGRASREKKLWVGCEVLKERVENQKYGEMNHGLDGAMEMKEN